MPTTFDYMTKALHLFERANRTEDLPPDIPKSWHDLHPWIQSNNWGHPGGIPLPTLDKLITRLQQRLDEVDPTESQIAALTQIMRAK